MPRRLILIALLALGRPAAADPPPAPAPPPAPPRTAETPLTPEQAADAVLAAVRAGDDVALKALAAKDVPDPWLVVDELLHGGNHDAAETFAGKAPRAAVRGLPAYAASRRGKASDEAARNGLRAANEALGRKAWAEVLEVVGEPALGATTLVEIRRLHARGIALAALRRLDEAAATQRAVAVAAESVGWLVRAKDAYSRSGTSAYDGSRWEDALSAWQALERVATTLGDGVAAARAVGNIGIVHYARGAYRDALAAWEKSLEGARAGSDRAGAARTLGNIGNAYERLGDYPKALSTYEQAMEEKRAVGDVVSANRTRGNIGLVHLGRGDLAMALAAYEAALSESRVLGDRAFVADSLRKLGNVRQQMGDYAKALGEYEEALKECRALGDRAGAAATLGNIASVHAQRGEYARALSLHEAALAEKRALGDRPGVAMTLANLANVYEYLDDGAKALALYRQALDEDLALGARARAAGILGNIGNLHSASGDHDEALALLERAMAEFRALGDRREAARVLGNIGLEHALLGDPTRALAIHERALAEKRALGDREGVAVSLGNLGSAHRALGDPGKALSRHEEALAEHREIGDRRGEVGDLAKIGDLHLAALDYDAALAASREGVRIASRLTERLADGEGLTARDQFSSLYETGIRAALGKGADASLAWFLEQSRAGSLREALGARVALQEAVIPEPLRRALAVSRARERGAADALRRASGTGRLEDVRESRRSLDSARTEVEAAVARVQRDARAGASLALGYVDDLDAIRSRLASDEALVLYGLEGDRLLALVVTHGGGGAVRLGPWSEVEAAASGLLEGLAASGTSEEVAGAAGALAKRVVEPLGLGAGVARVLVSPVGLLGYVPFSLLVEGKEIAYVPSATTYGLLLEARGQRGSRILALGDPDYAVAPDARAVSLHRAGTASRLVPLPASGDEAKAIGTDLRLGKDASESGLGTALAGRVRWRAVHFACHGIVDSARPMFSSLALTADGGEDGFLTAMEIFRMTIPADLVVLSACETGRGKIVRSEGIVGLTRSFMFAGAPRVICSLWKVDDEATRALMVEFYRRWDPKDGSKGMGTAAAIRAAQEHVRSQDKWKHPYYWAAWVLWGLAD